MPGNERPPYHKTSQARQILNDAEDDLRDWTMPEDLLSDEEGGAGDGFTGGATTPKPASVQSQGQGKGRQKSPDGQSDERPAEIPS